MLNLLVPAVALTVVAFAADPTPTPTPIPPITDTCLADCVKSGAFADLTALCEDVVNWNSTALTHSCYRKKCNHGWSDFPDELNTLCPPTPPPIPSITDTCLKGCIEKGGYTDLTAVCADTGRADLATCNQRDCHDDWHDFSEEY
ncbi:hypothetical protein BDV96DRAFT_647541 [Lophiotrema nucula]|uniref:Extracellular membrane protein CFEM domain-containing protein n=1 Tax=Lophiotrema nucula TaxID=690887 RepID=A0A6A5Z4V8_9PLEO|nr:hypothetical protein BDV96DRAFT_647541 [Lophiotrema nucula]